MWVPDAVAFVELCAFIVQIFGNTVPRDGGFVML